MPATTLHLISNNFKSKQLYLYLPFYWFSPLSINTKKTPKFDLNKNFQALLARQLFLYFKFFSFLWLILSFHHMYFIICCLIGLLGGYFMAKESGSYQVPNHPLTFIYVMWHQFSFSILLLHQANQQRYS